MVEDAERGKSGGETCGSGCFSEGDGGEEEKGEESAERNIEVD